MGGLLHVLGVWPPGTRWVNFWDGFGSGPVAWCVLPLVYWRHHLCHEDHCYRLGHPDSQGTVKCRRHQPRRPELRRVNS